MADIVDVAISAGNFGTLVAAVKAAGLVDTLKGSGPFTVFAPNDDAFAKLPEGAVEGLLNDVPKLTGRGQTHGRRCGEHEFGKDRAGPGDHHRCF